MTPTVYIWMPTVDPSRGTVARALGLAREAGRDSILGVRNGLRTRSLSRWLDHSFAGSVHGSLQVLSQFKAAIGLSYGHASIQLAEGFIGYWPPFREGEKCTPASRLLAEQLAADADALRDKSTWTAKDKKRLARMLNKALEEAAELTPYEQELLVMGREPSHTILLPGLDESAMAAYWNKRALQTEFANRAHNCCTVTQRAIEVGIEAMVNKMSFFDRVSYGAGAYCRAVFNPFKMAKAVAAKASGDALIWNPGDLYRYVAAIEKVVLGR